VSANMGPDVPQDVRTAPSPSGERRDRSAEAPGSPVPIPGSAGLDIPRPVG